MTPWDTTYRIPQEPLRRQVEKARHHGMADEAGATYQSLINQYLRDYLANKRKVQINWPQAV